MVWIMMLACAGAADGQDTSADPERFVQLFAKTPESSPPAWCAQRADLTLSCFGRESPLEGLDQDAQWRSVDLACGCGLDEGGEPVCWRDTNPAVEQLGAGPFSQMACDKDGEWAWGIAENSGEFKVVELGFDFVAMEEGTAVRSVSDPTRRVHCYLEYGTGALVCHNPTTVETGVTGTDFVKVSTSGGEIFGCVLDGAGEAEFFSPQGNQSIAPTLAVVPPLKKVVDTRALSMDGELVELYPPLGDEPRLPLGEYYVDYHVDTYADWDVGIPLEDPKSVVVLPEAIERMDILPPGWE